jgi:F-type H+-transporting ATPase subunit a
MNPLEHLSEEVKHLVTTLSGQNMYEPITTYTPFIIIVTLLVLALVLTAKRQLSLVPKNRFVGVMEIFVNFGMDNVGNGVHGQSARNHMPFLLTLFILILLSNFVGLIPGSKAATGTMGATVALAIISFVYYTFYGIKQHGGLGYLKSIGPSGIKPAPLGAFIWALEFISNILRLLTLSVRLFANMFAGHILLGTLAILTTLFFTPLIQAITAQTVLMGGASLLWLILLVVMYGLEVFIAAIQAYVFTMLSSVYIYLATSDH